MPDSGASTTDLKPAADGVQLTRERYTQLQQDLTSLRDADRPTLLCRIKRAPIVMDAASAEAAVSLAQQQLDAADQRIAELEALLAKALVIGEGPAPATAQLGHPVTVRYDDGTEQTVTLVPPAEADPWRGLVSAESPLGKALLGKGPGEQASVQAGSGMVSVTVDPIASPSETA